MYYAANLFVNFGLYLLIWIGGFAETIL